MRHHALTLAFVAFAFSIDASPAYAYIDPGIASVLLQGVVGGAATGLVVLRLYGARAKRKLQALFRGSHAPVAEDSDARE